MAQQDLFIEGVIHEIQPVESGESGRGSWQRRTFAIRVDREWESYVSFTLWRERCSLIDGFQVGDRIVVFFDVNSRNHEGRWYTDLRAYRISRPMQQPAYGYPQAGAPGYSQSQMYGNPGMPGQGYPPGSYPAQPQYPQQGYSQPGYPQQQPPQQQMPQQPYPGQHIQQGSANPQTDAPLDDEGPNDLPF